MGEIGAHDEPEFPVDTAVPQSPEDLEVPQTMIGRSPYNAALGNRPAPEKGRDALGRTEPWKGHSGEPPQGDGEVMFLGRPEDHRMPPLTEIKENGLTVAYATPPVDEPEIVPPARYGERIRAMNATESHDASKNPAPWKPDNQLYESHGHRWPDTLNLAEELLQQAMSADAEGMAHAIQAMTPADRDHIIASLHRALEAFARRSPSTEVTEIPPGQDEDDGHWYG